MLSITFGGIHIRSVLAPSIALRGFGGVTAFLSVLALATGRFHKKKPVLGPRRGAVIGVLVVVIVASVNSLFMFGSGGLLYSLVGQVGYAVVIGGCPAAAFGAFLGCVLERKHFIEYGA